jgi:hypothetical protein
MVACATTHLAGHRVEDGPLHNAGVLAYVVIYLFIVTSITSAQLRSRCDVRLALKASLQTVHHVLHAASS